MQGRELTLTRRQVRDFDRLAIDDWGVPGVVLMENAGRGAADAIEGFLGAISGRRVAVVAGRGNNGGDGFVIARHLHARAAAVVVFLVADPDKLTPDAAVNFQVLPGLGIQVRRRQGRAVAQMAAELREFELVVDALGGTGIKGALRGNSAAAVEQINAAGRPVVAVDIPTGLDCDTGAAPGPTVKADLTVTFVARKKGFDAPGAEAHTGKVVVADIGVPPPT
jgi:NAD(P)H-hydrate epimerase